MSALRTQTFEIQYGERLIRVEAGLVHEHFHVGATVDGLPTPLDRVLAELAGIEDPARPYVEAMIAVHDCNIDGIPRIRGLTQSEEPQAALRSAIAVALGPSGSDERLSELLRHALPPQDVPKARAAVAERVAAILDLDHRKGDIIEKLLRLEESAEQASDGFKSQFSLFAGANLRRMKAQIGVIAGEFRGDFEFLGFPQVDVSIEGSREGLARKCETVKNRAAAVSAAYRLGPGSLPHSAFSRSVSEAVALTAVDTQILDAVLGVWNAKAAVAREILGLEDCSAAASGRSGPNGMATAAATTKPVPASGPGAGNGPSVAAGDCNAKAVEPHADAIALVRRRLGENIGALLEAKLLGRILAQGDEEDLRCAIEFLSLRHPEMKTALGAILAKPANGEPLPRAA